MHLIDYGDKLCQPENTKCTKQIHLKTHGGRGYSTWKENSEQLQVYVKVQTEVYEEN